MRGPAAHADKGEMALPHQPVRLQRIAEAPLELDGVRTQSGDEHLAGQPLAEVEAGRARQDGRAPAPFEGDTILSLNTALRATREG